MASETVVSEEIFALWPENLPAFRFWQVVQTQWRHDARGCPTGLDYGGVQACMDMQRIRKNDRAELFAGLQAMEFSTLETWARQKNEGRRKSWLTQESGWRSMGCSR